MAGEQSTEHAGVQIKQGDVLLFHGNSFISWAIRRFDGSDVNHAAIAIDAATMIEAAGQGLRSTPITDALAGNERTYIRRLTSEKDLSPVVAKANAYLAKGVPYAYQQIVLLGFLALSRKLPLGNRLLRRALRVALDRAAQLLNAIVDSGSTLMICSEYVFRCYEDTKDPRYRLEILPPDQRPQALSARPGEERLLDWARQRPEPKALPETDGLGGSVGLQALARQGDSELEESIGAYAREVAPEDPEISAHPMPATQGVQPDVTDDELLRAACAFRDAVIAHTQASGAPQPVGLLIDPWSRFSVEADFVTPGDLLYCSSLTDIATLSRGTA